MVLWNPYNGLALYDMYMEPIHGILYVDVVSGDG